jgi:lysophospholipase L1-like esterase
VSINSDGLRGPEIGPRAPGEYRVLVLGDSVVAGFEVAYEDTFVALMEKDLTRSLGIPVRVINGGVRGYGTDQYYLYYTEKGRRLRPDLVLVVHSSNDPNDNITLHRVRRPFGKPAFSVAPDRTLKLVGAPTPRYPLCSAVILDATFAPARVDGPFNRLVCTVQTRAADRSALFTFVAQALGRMPDLVTFLKDLGYPDAQRVERAVPVRAAGVLPGVAAARADSGGVAPQWVLTTEIFSHLAGAVRQDGADLFVLIRPPNLAKMDAPRLLAEGIDFREVGIPPYLSFRTLRFVNDAHYNEPGHRVVAEGLEPIVAAYARKRRPELGPGPLPDQVRGRLRLRDLRDAR